MPRVSVLLPLYNHAGHCHRAIRSILDQSWRDLELVVVDDGSTDDGVAVAETAVGGDGRVRIMGKAHGGIVSALNHALGGVDCEFVARMDADDFSHPRRLQLQLAKLSSDPRLGAVDCTVSLATSPVTGDGMHRHIAWLNSLVTAQAIQRALFVESPLVHPAVLMKRAALEKAGGYLDAPGPEDYSLWLRMVAAGFRLGKLDQCLFEWTDLPQRLTRTHPDYAPRALFQLKASMLPRLHPRCAEGVQIWGAGQAGRRLRKALSQQQIPVRRFFDIDPRKVGRTLGEAPVLPLEDLVEHRDLLTLVAIGVSSAKQLVRQWASKHGWEEGEDLVLCA